jgi:hypothetical protein
MCNNKGAIALKKDYEKAIYTDFPHGYIYKLYAYIGVPSSEREIPSK